MSKIKLNGKERKGYSNILIRDVNNKPRLFTMDLVSGGQTDFIPLDDVDWVYITGNISKVYSQLELVCSGSAVNVQGDRIYTEGIIKEYPAQFPLQVSRQVKVVWGKDHDYLCALNDLKASIPMDDVWAERLQKRSKILHIELDDDDTRATLDCRAIGKYLKVFVDGKLGEVRMDRLTSLWVKGAVEHLGGARFVETNYGMSCKRTMSYKEEYELCKREKETLRNSALDNLKSFFASNHK